MVLSFQKQLLDFAKFSQNFTEKVYGVMKSDWDFQMGHLAPLITKYPQ